MYLYISEPVNIMCICMRPNVCLLLLLHIPLFADLSICIYQLFQECVSFLKLFMSSFNREKVVDIWRAHRSGVDREPEHRAGREQEALPHVRGDHQDAAQHQSPLRDQWCVHSLSRHVCLSSVQIFWSANLSDCARTFEKWLLLVHFWAFWSKKGFLSLKI